MAKYAEHTEVPADRSRVEIERILQRWGASKFMYGWEEERAVVAFEMRDRQIKFIIPLPSRDAREFQRTPVRRKQRTQDQAMQAWEQATRQRWRALALIIKAKLEAVEGGASTFEDEFSARFVLSNGQTVGEWLHPQIERAYLAQRMPPMLPLPIPWEDSQQAHG